MKPTIEADTTDTVVRTHFEELRAEEARIAPSFGPFVDDQIKDNEKAVSVSRLGVFFPPIARAAVVVLAATALLLTTLVPDKSQETNVDLVTNGADQDSPDLLYSNIMQHQLVRTDELLTVSFALMPSMQPVPTIHSLDTDLMTSAPINL